MPTDTNDKRIINLGNLRTAIDNIKSTFVKKTGDTITGNLTATTFTEGNQLLSNKYQAKLTFDNTPTLNSTNPVTSNGIKAAINAVANDVSTLSGIINAADTGLLARVTAIENALNEINTALADS